MTWKEKNFHHIIVFLLWLLLSLDIIIIILVLGHLNLLFVAQDRGERLREFCLLVQTYDHVGKTCFGEEKTDADTMWNISWLFEVF